MASPPHRKATISTVISTAALLMTVTFLPSPVGGFSFASKASSRIIAGKRGHQHIIFTQSDRRRSRHGVPMTTIATIALHASSRDELESMTVKVLRQTVKDLELPVKGLSKMRKAELVDLLLESRPSASPEEEEEEAEILMEEEEEEVEEDDDEEIEIPAPTITPEVSEVDEQDEVEPTVDDATTITADAGASVKTPAPTDTAFIKDIQSPGVETLREFLKYSDYGINKMQDQRQKGEAILSEIEGGKRDMPKWYYEDFEEEAEDEVDDERSIVADEWGSWDERDLGGPPMMGDWDPNVDPDPNVLDPEFEYVSEIPKDEDGIEKGYDPAFGSWYPIDERSIVNPSESYIIDEKTRNATSVPKIFPDDNDPENLYNADVKAFRKSLKLVETYVDEWTGLEHPRYVAKWHGTPPLEKYPDKDFMNNRFTDPDAKTDFSKLDPYRARKKAVELARSKNNEWLPRGKSATWHDSRTKIFSEKGVLAGSFLEGEKDSTVVDQIQPALDVLGASADLLSIQDTVFRFHYHGLIKNKRGMAAWTETLIRDCGVECTGVVFETGTRKRDPKYDHGDHWHGPY